MQIYHHLTKILTVVIGMAATACSAQVPDMVYQTEQQNVRLTEVVGGLDSPWAVTFLPGGGLLITEKGGHLWRVSDGERKTTIRGTPPVAQIGQGGLLDVALHPDFTNNRWIYLSYAGAGEDGYGTEVVRGRLQDNAVQEVEVIFRALPKYDGGRHFGSRLQFGADGKLYISLGDRGQRDPAQDRSNHIGSLIRLNPDGSVPADNPFVGQQGIEPEIFTYGNRNMQGMTLQPGTGIIWTNEHGPQGGDELNLMTAGTNYGWPVITYGVNYGTGTQVGEGTHKAGMAQPAHYWDPSIATSGLAFSSGEPYPAWNGDAFVGSLKFGFVARLELNDNNEVINEERLFGDALERVRGIRQGPDGYLYILDEGLGKLLRVEPAE